MPKYIYVIVAWRTEIVKQKYYGIIYSWPLLFHNAFHTRIRHIACQEERVQVSLFSNTLVFQVCVRW